ncbi:MAG: CHC2 zinc finger domain-containing protein, partial [Opitutaceae bacterium]
MAMIPEEEIERIKRETDLAAVVRSRGVELKRQGGDLIGHCPFHPQPDKHPSLHVTPGKGLWRCVSCQATGNVIQFVQKFDGVSWRHAFELLKAALDAGGAAVPAPGRAAGPVKKSTVPKLASPLAVDADDQAALRQVIDYYHARLQKNPAALAYLAKRGLRSEAALAAFRVGFVDRTLGLRLPQKNRAAGATLRARLARLGVMRETGHEHFRGRIVFPVVAEDGVIGTLYGRAIADVPKPDRHLFLPGPQNGLWNPAALRAPEVILTEGIIDALTFWCAGYRHVTTTMSAGTLPEQLLDALRAARTQRVLFAFDRDDAGDGGVARHAAQLAAHGIECLRVMFPPGHDANSYALAVTPPENSLGLLLRSAVPLDGSRRLVSPPSSSRVRAPSSLAAEAANAAPQPNAAETTNTPPPTPPEAAARKEAAAKSTVAPTTTTTNDNTTAATPASPAAPPGAAVTIAKNEPEEIVLVIGDREYRVRGLAKNVGIESLKVALRVTCGERWHLDTIDLCLARQRDGFINAAAAETTLKPELIKRDLGHVLRQLEELQEARLRAALTPKKNEPTLSAQERESALALLRDPHLLDRIIADFAACGLVGERTNKLVGYLAAVSRLLDRPLAVIVRATTAAGKSWLMDAILALTPPECRVKYSALTGQALYYLGGDANLKHKILAIVEEEGAEKASYALKLLQSEGELSIASTGKDPHTGRMVTQEYRVEGPVMIFLTTTAVDLDEELLNRCLVLTVDESREQTAAIHAAQRRAETLAGLREDEQRAAVLALHRAAQRLLRPLKVVNPFGEQLTFLDDRTRTRRDHKKYLTLIRTIALLHQHQRPVKTMLERGKPVEYIEVTREDIAAANRLAHDVLG